VYVVIVAPPLLAGAVNATVAVVAPVAVADPIVGAPGAIADTLAVALELADELPIPLVPVTTHLIGLLASAATSVYVLFVALDILTPFRCH
jgi:hypothetical protein